MWDVQDVVNVFVVFKNVVLQWIQNRFYVAIFRMINAVELDYVVTVLLSKHVLQKRAVKIIFSFVHAFWQARFPQTQISHVYAQSVVVQYIQKLDGDFK